MIFCKNCNNLYFVSTDLENNSIFLNCGNCNIKKKYDESEDGVLQFTSNNSTNINIECKVKQLELDSTLPRKILYCNSQKCKSKQTHVCLKYDTKELKYIFKCLNCNLLWKNKN